MRALDVGWAAGFLEGEGSFLFNRTPRISAAQVQEEPLLRLQKLFGGRVGLRGKPTSAGNPVHFWYIHGQRALEVCFTLFALMSPKRRAQIARTVERWKCMPGAGAPGVPRPYAAALAANARTHLTRRRAAR